MKEYEVLIIGGGPAAITIAKNLKQKKEIAIIRPEDHSMIYCAMPYAIDGVLPYEKTLKHDKIVTDSGAVLIRDLVESVDFDKKTLKAVSGETYHYSKLVIATGAEPILPPIEGVKLQQVMTFKTANDLKKIMDIVEEGLEEAIVVGAGAIGIELIQALNNKNVKSHLVDMATTILPNMMDEEMVGDAHEELKAAGVNMYLGEKVSRLHGDDYVTEVIFESGKSIKCDTNPLIVFAVGMKPTVDIFRDTALKIGRSGIIVTDKMETNIKDVYAVGDCCEFTSAITGKVSLGKLATNAVPMGRLLAKNMLGEDRKYSGFYNGAATKTIDTYVGGTGLSEKAAKEHGYDYLVGKAKFKTAFPIMHFAKDVEMKLIVDKKTRKVIGGQITSGEPVTDKVDLITMAIQYGITIDQLAQFSYSSQPYQSFYPANNLIAHAAEQAIEQF